MKFNRHELASVKAYLADFGWQLQSKIQSATGVTGSKLRAMANAHPQTFISSQQGYKLARQATSAELDDALRVLMSRAESIMHRSRSLQRYILERSKFSRSVAAVRKAA